MQDSTYNANYKYTHQFGLTAQAKRKMWDPIHGLLIDRESKIPLISTGSLSGKMDFCPLTVFLAASHYCQKKQEGPKKIFCKKKKREQPKNGSIALLNKNMSFSTTYRDLYRPISLPAIDLAFKRDPNCYR